MSNVGITFRVRSNTKYHQWIQLMPHVLGHHMSSALLNFSREWLEPRIPDGAYLCFKTCSCFYCFGERFLFLRVNPVYLPEVICLWSQAVGAYQHHQRWRPHMPIWGGSISWTTNKFASARNTAVAFYPGVYRGVIYISAGKAVSKKIYRLVGELYLDWIFSCINRGKIIIW